MEARYNYPSQPEMEVHYNYPSHHLVVQSQQWNYQKNLRNILKS